MPTGKPLRIALGAAALAAAATAAILLNLALLGYAQPRNDPVGKLSPLAVVQPGASLPPPVVTTVEHAGGGENDD